MTFGIVSSMFLSVNAEIEKGTQPAITGDPVTVTEYTNWRSIDGNEASEITFNGPAITINRKLDTLNLNVGVEVDFEPVDATGKRYFEFWLGTSEASEMFATNVGFRLFSKDGSAADIYKSNGTVNYYLFIGGKWIKNTVASNFCLIPVGYDGYIRVDLEQFGSNVPDYCGNGKQLDDSQLYHINFWIGPTDEQEEKNLYVSDFRFVNADDMEIVDIPDEEVIIPKMPAQPAILGDEIKLAEDISSLEFLAVNDGAQELEVVDSDGVKLVKIRNLRYSGAEPGFAVRFNTLDVSDKQFLEFWIDTTLVSSAFSPMKLGIRLFDEDGAAADIFAANFLVDYYLLEDGQWESYFVEGNRCTIPSEYCGYFRLDISQFVEAVSEYCGNGNVMDLSKVNELWVFYNTDSAQYNKSTYIGGIRFVNSVEGGNTTEPVADTDSDIESGNDTAKEPASSDTENGDKPTDEKKSGSLVWIIVAAAAVVVIGVVVAIVLKKKKSN